MLPSTFTLVAAFLPLLAFTDAKAHANAPHPPHLRHRRISNAIRQVDENENAPRAIVAPRDNYGHSQAKKIIKKSVKKRGQTCRPRNGPNTFLSTGGSAAAAPSASAPASSAASSSAAAPASSAPVSSEAPANDWTPTSSADGSWSATTASWESATTSASSNNNGGGSNTGGTISVNDGNCGYSNADANSPNGAEGWLNCGLDGAGWNPPMVTVDQLIASDLHADGIFAPCGPYIDKFNQYASQYGLKGIMLASFAMQESTCNPSATGGNGEAGLMQLASMNCHGAPGGNCYDIDFNIQRAAELFSNLIDSNGGNVLLAIGSYNGWSKGLTIAQATAAANEGRCQAQNNLDYIYQYCNGWMLGKSGYELGSYCKHIISTAVKHADDLLISRLLLGHVVNLKHC
ncbi:hypothetical protein I316_04524 [Kwoniella heveanensis BCC8398]|uniref:Transglycosylase SLT domain-containing protein n=1 Tax=Kwoniella heveanensis BCC8398 TaxID=1296120 RepID=A0A1B9GRX5_9TREE|nr:hypothetical protein I316_04524 [Kwoniella heveanensis BCC8398]